MVTTLKDKREGYYFRETLSSVLCGLIGKYTVIDLRNEASVYGKVNFVSGFMDVELENCIFQNPRGDFFPFETFFVKSRNIRYVHIPEGYTSQQLIEIGIKGDKPDHPRKQPQQGKKPVYKMKRAQTYQTQILKELQSTQKT